MADQYFLSAEDVAAIRALIADSRNRIQQVNTQNRAGDQSIDHQEVFTPEVYVALSPAGGIPGMVGASGVPGSVNCVIQRLINGQLSGLDPFFKTVYNLSETIPAGIWVIVGRDKFGTWWVLSSQGEIAGTGTVTLNVLTCFRDSFIRQVVGETPSPFNAGTGTARMDFLLANSPFSNSEAVYLYSGGAGQRLLRGTDYTMASSIVQLTTDLTPSQSLIVDYWTSSSSGISPFNVVSSLSMETTPVEVLSSQVGTPKCNVDVQTCCETGTGTGTAGTGTGTGGVSCVVTSCCACITGGPNSTVFATVTYSAGPCTSNTFAMVWDGVSQWQGTDSNGITFDMVCVSPGASGTGSSFTFQLRSGLASDNASSYTCNPFQANFSGSISSPCNTTVTVVVTN